MLVIGRLWWISSPIGLGRGLWLLFSRTGSFARMSTSLLSLDRNPFGERNSAKIESRYGCSEVGGRSAGAVGLLLGRFVARSLLGLR